MPQEEEEEKRSWWHRVWDATKAFVVSLFTDDSKKSDGNAGGSNFSGLSFDGKCNNCTVHSGFYKAYEEARTFIIPKVQELKTNYPDYELQ